MVLGFSLRLPQVLRILRVPAPNHSASGVKCSSPSSFYYSLTSGSLGIRLSFLGDRFVVTWSWCSSYRHPLRYQLLPFMLSSKSTMSIWSSRRNLGQASRTIAASPWPSSNNLPGTHAYGQRSLQHSASGFNYLVTSRALILYTSILELDVEFVSFLVAMARCLTKVNLRRGLILSYHWRGGNLSHRGGLATSD